MNEKGCTGEGEAVCAAVWAHGEISPSPCNPLTMALALHSIALHCIALHCIADIKLEFNTHRDHGAAAGCEPAKFAAKFARPMNGFSQTTPRRQAQVHCNCL